MLVVETTSAPAARAIAEITARFEFQIWPGPSGSPGGTSSSPVATIETVGREWQSTGSLPVEASRPSSTGPIRLPANSTSEPAAIASPRRRMFWPAVVAARTITPSSVRAVSSTRTTASAPAGTSAPVEIETAWPPPREPSQGAPALDSPTTVSPASPPS